MFCLYPGRVVDVFQARARSAMVVAILTFSLSLETRGVFPFPIEKYKIVPVVIFRLVCPTLDDDPRDSDNQVALFSISD